MAHDKNLADHERAHNGQPGSKVRHGANASGSNIRAQNAALDQPRQPNPHVMEMENAFRRDRDGKGWF